MTDRFDFEQEIMRCWSVVEDMRIVAETNCTPENFEALATIYDIKFNSLFEMFEQMIRDRKIT
jgi:hypothetical protein